MFNFIRRIKSSGDFNCRCTAVLKSSFHEGGPWNILYFGTDQFAIRPLDCLYSLQIHSDSGLVNNIEVVCPLEKRRPKDIKQQNKTLTVRQFAERNGLVIHNWPLDRKNLDFLSRFHLGIVVSFGHFIPSWIINNLLCGAVNVHPSFLPKWRGPSPMIHTLLNEDNETGVSIIEVSPKKFDAGKILLQKRVEISKIKKYEELSKMLSTLSSDMLLDVLTNFNDYKKNAMVQDETKVIEAPKVTKEVAYVKWGDFTCKYIEKLWHVVGHRFGVKCKWDDQVVKLETLVDTCTSPPGAPDSAVYGQPFFDSSKNVLYIKCKDGWLGCTSLKMEHRKSITGKEFYNGYLVDKNTGEITSTVFEDIR